MNPSLLARSILRRWRRTPLVTLGIVLVLALGIGVVGQGYSSVDGMLLRPLPYAGEDRLVAITQSQPREGRTWLSVSARNYDDYRRDARGFEAMAAIEMANVAVGGEERPERVPGARVTADFMRVLGTPAALGRGFEAGEDRDEGTRVAVISDALWRRRFHAEPGAVGRTIRIDGRDHLVIGVMPPRYEFPEWTEVWTPLVLDLAGMPRERRTLDVVARLRPGWSLERAWADLRGIADQQALRYPATNRGWSVHVRTLRERLLPPAARAGVVSMLGSVVLVLLLVCANVANLLLAESMGRRQDVAIRSALGAARWRLIAESLAESVALSAAGGLLGVLVTQWLTDALVAVVPFQIPRWIDLSLNGRAVAATAATALLSGVAFGLAPAFRGTTATIASVQRGAGSQVGPAGAGFLRQALLAFQIVNSLVLLVGALLIVQSAVSSRLATLGMDTGHALVLRVAFPAAAYPEARQRATVIDRMLEGARGVPGVVGAAAADLLPASSAGHVPVSLEAEGQPRTATTGIVAARMAGTDAYPAVLGLTLHEGRWLRREEIERGAPLALVSRALARRLWPGQGAVGRRLRPAASQTDDDWLTVAGVVSDVERPHQMKGADLWPEAQLYLPLGPGSLALEAVIAVRTAGDPRAVAAAVTAALQAEVPDAPLFDVKTLDAVLRRLVWLPVLWAQMFSVFAALALVIAAVGIYSFTAYSVGVRYQEFGIRAALGASPRVLFRLAVGRVALVGASALAAGLALSRLLAGILPAMLDEVDPSRPAAYVVVLLVLGGVLLAGSLVPARRAARADALVLLRTP